VPRHQNRVSWFSLVPAYRLATLRVCLAVTSLVFHVPKFNRFIDAYVSSAYHVPPAIPLVPPLTHGAAAMLMMLNYGAASGLLLGLYPRLCAWLLTAIGFYVISLDPEYYAHNAQFHLTLLALIGCSSDRVPLWRLLSTEQHHTEQICAAWPERLVQLQLSIVLFYAALDKVFNPHWGLSGAVLATLAVRDHAPGMASLAALDQAVIHAFPGAVSALTTALEFFLAAAFVFRSLWRVGIVVAFAFMVYLEFLLRPGVFTWDMVAALIVFLPAADRSWRVMQNPQRAAYRWSATLLLRLDWLRRLRLISIDASHCRGGTTWLGFILVSPRGREYRAFAALRMLPILLPGPFFVMMAMARFGGGFLGSLGYGPWYDLPFVGLGLWLLLWTPDAMRMVARVAHGAVALRLVESRRRSRRRF
jgi:Vitamin K-dependent gamma-carboxylase